MYVEHKVLMQDVVQGLMNEGINEETFNEARALHAIRRAYQEFVRDTNVLRRTITLPLQANVNEYRLFEDDNHIIRKIYSVSVEDECGNWCCYSKAKICSCNCCHKTYGYQEGFVSLCPAPKCDGTTAELCVSVTPKTDSCVMDERLFELYHEYIVSGALSKLLPRSKARGYRRDFTIGKDIASNESSKQWSSSIGKSQKSQWRRR